MAQNGLSRGAYETQSGCLSCFSVWKMCAVGRVLKFQHFLLVYLLWGLYLLCGVVQESPDNAEGGGWVTTMVKSKPATFAVG